MSTMKLTLRFALLLLHVGCFLIQEAVSLDYNQPISPEVYALELGQGFATSWFKALPVPKKYTNKTVTDVYNAGFRNFRLRCRADLFTAPYEDEDFEKFLDALEMVVNKCLDVGVFPIISWIHHQAEAWATEKDQDNYIAWWTKVATRLNYKDYRLSFNLFTELGIDECQATSKCKESLKRHDTKYNTWTSRVVTAIRNITDGNSKKRILILASPMKKAKGLKKIDEAIYKDDPYMMAEFHTYAAGPNKIEGSPNFWEGNGNETQRANLLNEIATAEEDITLKTYFGAWMPTDNIFGKLSQTEVEIFAQFFCSVLKDKKIPWSLNVIDRYYNTLDNTWTTTEEIGGIVLNMTRILKVITDYM